MTSKDDENMTKNSADVRTSTLPTNSEPVTPNSELLIWAQNTSTGVCLRTCLEPFIAVFKTAVFGIKTSLKCLTWCRTVQEEPEQAEQRKSGVMR